MLIGRPLDPRPNPCYNERSSITHHTHMIAEVFIYSKLPAQYRTILNQTFPDQQIVYVVKDCKGNPKSITTSVTQAIAKVQKVK